MGVSNFFLSLCHSKVNWLETAIVTPRRRARCDRDHQIHLSHKVHMIPRLCQWCLDINPASLAVNPHIHEAVERNRDGL